MWALSDDGKRTSSESQIQSNNITSPFIYDHSPYVSTKPFARVESATGMRIVTQ